MSSNKPLPPPPTGCAPAASYDSRGPGWYCCVHNRYNEAKRTTCQDCGHRRCGSVKEGE